LSSSSYAFQQESRGPILEVSPKKGIKLSSFRDFPESMDQPEGFDQKAAERILENFLTSPQDSDQTLSAEQAGELLSISKARREKLESLDKGGEVDKLKDTDSRAGHVPFENWGVKSQTELGEKGLVQLFSVLRHA
jgi:hypothetical protein